MKLTKEVLKQIIKEELQAVLREDENLDEAVLNFFLALRRITHMWSRDASTYDGVEVNGFSYNRKIFGQTKTYKMMSGELEQRPDPSQILRNVTTVVDIPGLQTYGGSIAVSTKDPNAGKYGIRIFIVARDSSKNTSSAFNSMGNQSYLTPITSDMKEFPQDGSELAKFISQKEEQFSQQLMSKEFSQLVMEKIKASFGESSVDQLDYDVKLREIVVSAATELASKVYGIGFKPEV